MKEGLQKVQEVIARGLPEGRFRDLKDTLVAYVLPRPRLLEDEEIKLELRQAPYRHAIPSHVLRWWMVLIIVIFSLVLAAALWFATRSLLISLFGLLPLTIFVWAIREIVHHKQWMILITNRRTIIYRPDPRSWLLVDDVRMKGGKIQVIDTEFSRNPWWGMFQTWSGARDLIISLSGYAFAEGQTQIKDGVRFPDVMPEDIRKLEEIVF